MPGAAPSISVIVPAWNAERYLEEALDSIGAQTLSPTEVIVVDDGSTDATASVCTGRDVRYVHQPNAGPGVARNRGVELSTGSILAFCDADDLWMPEKLALQVAALADDAVDVVFGLGQNFISPDRAEAMAGRTVDTRVMAALLPSALLVRRTVIDAVGPFATQGTLTDWTDWYLRMRRLEVQVAVPEHLVVRRRVHGDNATLREQGARQAYLDLARNAARRHRTDGAGGPDTSPAR